MKKSIPFVAWGVLVFGSAVLVGREYFKAVRNDLFQVWSAIKELRVTTDELKSIIEGDEK